MCDQTHTLSTEEYIKLYKKRINVKTKRNWVDSVVESIPEGYEWVAESLVTAMNDESSLTELGRHGVALVAAILANNGELAFEICMNSPLFGTPEREIAKKCAVMAEMIRIEGSRRITEIHYDNDQSKMTSLEQLFFSAAAIMIRGSFENPGPELKPVKAICAAVSVLNKIII